MLYLKKFLLFFLCLVLILSQTGCKTGNGKEGRGSGGKSSEAEGNAETSASEESLEEILSKAPAYYDYALIVKINPEFILYLLGHEVVAYEALNNDAPAVEERTAFLGRPLDGVLNDIVRFSYEEGFLQDGGDVTVTLVSAFSTEPEANALLEEAKSAINKTAEDCGISVNPIITIESRVSFLAYEESEGPSREDQDSSEEDSQQEDQAGESNQQEADQQEGESGNQDQESESESSYLEPSQDSEESHEERSEHEGCSVCGGSGICDRCLGSGTMECGVCGGYGWETCTMCHGTGYAGYDENGPKVCTQCGGSGELLCGHCAGTGLEACNGCQGLGICSACGGTGLKPDD